MFPPAEVAFPIENRAAMGQGQSAASLKPILRRPLPFHAKIADFHLLLFLARDAIFDIKVVPTCACRGRVERLEIYLFI